MLVWRVRTLRGFLLWSANRSPIVASRVQYPLKPGYPSAASISFSADTSSRTVPTRMFASSTTADSTDGSESDDSAKRIRLPNLKYGYRSEPFDWEELTALFDANPPDLARLSRSVEQQRDYEVFKRDLLLTWRSIIDSILCEKFDAVFARKLDHGKYIADPSLSDVKGVHSKLVLNDFPYYMVPGIDHYVLWKIGDGACSDKDIQDGKQQLVQMGYDNNIIHWVNPPNLKSIPEVDHAHLLARRMVKGEADR